MGNLVIPKASQKSSEAEHAIQIYYEAGGWLTNVEFIEKYKEKFGRIGTADDDSAYTKRGQIGAYFGFIEWEDIRNDQSRRRITPRGKCFWEHVSAGDTDAMHEDIMLALEEVTFGRGNYGCPTSDSDLEPMAIFFHSALALGYLSNGDFAYILWSMDSQNESLEIAIRGVKTARDIAKKVGAPTDFGNFSQPTPIAVLGQWGVLTKIRVSRSTPHKISDQFLKKYRSRIEALRIWNTAKKCSLPVKSALSSIEQEYGEKEVVSASGIIVDAVYQDLVDSAEAANTDYLPERYISHFPDGKNQRSNRPSTNPALGKEAIKEAEYKCSVNSLHCTFLKKDGTNFMEVHHLIPLEYQSVFEFKLDTKANLVSVCPLCHKLIHYGRPEDKLPIITRLYQERKEFLERSGLVILLEQLLSFYA